MKRSKVFVLYTGGTIGMAPKDPSREGSPLEPQSFEKLKRFVPNLEQLKLIDLTYDSFEEQLDSSSIEPKHWLEIARRIESVYDEYDGFIVLHGTDTMAYTASGLTFIFENLSKPVVVTGSQMPLSSIRTDGVMNLINAIYVAGYKSTQLPKIPEVVVLFADRILRGCRARKVSSSSLAGFDSPNYPPLGRIGEHIRIDRAALRPEPSQGRAFSINTDLKTEVLDLTLFPGFKSTQIEEILNIRGVEAIILRTYGAGNAPETESFLKVIERVLADDQKTIVNVSQCLEGMVEMGLYAASSGLLEHGVISGLDMTPEAALAKLFWTLGTKLGDQKVIQMQVSQRGEQSENLFDLRYGSCGNVDEATEKFDNFVSPDGRFHVSNLIRTVIRLKALGFEGVELGSEVSLRVFINRPAADGATLVSDAKCVGEVKVAWDGVPVNVVQILDQDSMMRALSDGAVTVSLRVDEGTSFWFDGLFLALFTSSDP